MEENFVPNFVDNIDVSYFSCLQLRIYLFRNEETTHMIYLISRYIELGKKSRKLSSGLMGSCSVGAD